MYEVLVLLSLYLYTVLIFVLYYVQRILLRQGVVPCSVLSEVKTQDVVAFCKDVSKLSDLIEKLKFFL